MADIKLDNIEVVIMVDTSGTMRTKDAGSNGSLKRLDAVKEVAGALAAELEEYDDDGITVVRFASLVDVRDGVTASTLDNLFMEFRPMGNTATDEALKVVIDKFLDKRASKGDQKPLCIICFTDGRPDNEKGVAQVIIDATKRIKDRSELGILFVQVGKDEDATKYLDVLDNALTKGGAAHDIVAVTQLDKLEKISTVETIAMAFTR
jgi:Mg-chelatase subunit ChlD